MHVIVSFNLYPEPGSANLNVGFPDASVFILNFTLVPLPLVLVWDISTCSLFAYHFLLRVGVIVAADDPDPEIVIVGTDV